MPHAPDHPPQPHGGQLRVCFSSAGAIFVDERSRDARSMPMIVTLKHGRVTISGGDRCDGEANRYLRNRHIQAMHVLTAGRTSLRVELSDLCVDLFDGLDPAELKWVNDVVDSELRRHRRRKQAALERESVPDRWRYPVEPFPSWHETKGLLLLTSFLTCVSACVLCLWQISIACRAMDGLPLDPDLKWRLVAWVPTAFVTLALSVQLGFSMVRWHDIRERPLAAGSNSKF